MPDQVWKRGANRPAISFQLDLGVDENNDVRDLTNVEMVEQHMRLRNEFSTDGDPIVVTRELEILDRAQRRVGYTPIMGDHDISGFYDVEYDLWYFDGSLETSPINVETPYREYQILPDLF